ncbi:MAG TPA: hypothetical protein PLZ93_25345, partial [Nocardioides sp.]|nr:hypothetical protein [Nocardioides sp.]
APAPRPAVPRAPVLNPFLGVPIGDYVRDGAALVCLFAVLGKPWDIDGDGTDHWWVILSALVAICSLAVPYVAASRALPALGRDQSQLLKFALTAPLLISVLAAVVNELVHATDYFEGGLGAGVALATAGALFAVQPRAADEDLAHRDDRRWWAATTSLAVVAVALSIATFAAFVLRDLTGDTLLFDEPVAFMSLVVSPLLTLVVVYGGALLGLLARQFQGVLVFAVVTLTAAGVALLTGDDPTSLFRAYLSLREVGPVEHWDSIIGGVFLLSGAGALAVSRPALRTASAGVNSVHAFLLTARLALGLVGIGGFLVPISYVLGLVAADIYPAAVIVAVVLWVALAVLALVAVSLLSGATLNRLAVVVLAAAIPVIGIVLVAVVRSSDGFARVAGTLSLDTVATVLLFTLPLLAVGALTAPAAVRRTYGPLLPERAPVQPAQQWPAQQWPAQEWSAQQPGQQWVAQPPTQPPTQPPGPPTAPPSGE